MEFGVIGLGRMGHIVVERTLAAGHTVVAYDRDPAAVDAATDAGAVGVDDLPIRPSPMTPSSMRQLQPRPTW